MVQLDCFSSFIPQTVGPWGGLPCRMPRNWQHHCCKNVMQLLHEKCMMWSQPNSRAKETRQMWLINRSMKQNINCKFKMNPFHSNRCCLHSLWTDDPSPNDEPEFQYYMNEGVYGSFASKLAETLIAAPSVHKVSFKDLLWVFFFFLLSFNS